MKRIAIIPARGGSKRIPRKNIKPFLGKPIIAYSIEVALESKLFDEVMVSTDDAEIAEVAKKYGAKVPFLRSKKNADDYATTAQVLLEVLEQYSDSGLEFRQACCIYPTAPLVSADSLKEAFSKLDRGQYDSVIPVVAFSYPIWRSLKIEDDRLAMNWPEHLQSRSQDLPTAYHDAGQFYCFDVYGFKQSKELISANTSAILLSESQVQDIDTEEDWKMAELKAQLLFK